MYSVSTSIPDIGFVAPTDFQTTDDKLSQLAKDIVSRGFKDAGITDKKPFEVLARQLDAKKTVFDKFGNGEYEDDNQSQLKATELAFKLKRLLDVKVDEIKTATVTVQMNAKDIDRLEATSTELVALEARLHSDKSQRGKVIDVEVG